MRDVYSLEELIIYQDFFLLEQVWWKSVGSEFAFRIQGAILFPNFVAVAGQERI